MTLGVSQEASPGAVERRPGADAAEDVEELALGGCRVPYVVGGDERQPRSAREVDEAARPLCLLALVMAADLDVEAPAAEVRAQAVECRSRIAGMVDLGRRILAEDSVLTARRERDQPRRMLFEIVETETAFALRRAQLAGRKQAAEIAVSAAVLHEEI